MSLFYRGISVVGISSGEKNMAIIKRCKTSELPKPRRERRKKRVKRNDWMQFVTRLYRLEDPR